MAKRTRSILLVRFTQPPLDEPPENTDSANDPDASASAQPPSPPEPTYESLGTRAELERTFARYNIAPDGSPESPTTLYGPGVVLTMPMVGSDDEVKQIMVTINEESVAWQVIMRLCADLKLRLAEAG